MIQAHIVVDYSMTQPNKVPPRNVGVAGRQVRGQLIAGLSNNHEAVEHGVSEGEIPAELLQRLARNQRGDVDAAAWISSSRAASRRIHHYRIPHGGRQRPRLQQRLPSHIHLASE